MRRTMTALFIITLCLSASLASAATIVSPGNLQGWSPQNIRFTGTVAITTTYPRNGNGSLRYTQLTGADKADFEIYQLPDAGHPLGFGRLADLTWLSYDNYRLSSSSVAAHLAPAVRLVIYEPASNKTSLLIWEPVYNGISTVPVDTWNSYSIRDGYFWMRAFGSPSCTVENYNTDLNTWLSGASISSPGCTGNPVGPNALIIGLSIGIGSGWSGTFDGAVDNVSWTINGQNTTWNFEQDQATPTQRSSWGKIKTTYR